MDSLLPLLTDQDGDYTRNEISPNLRLLPVGVTNDELQLVQIDGRYDGETLKGSSNNASKLKESIDRRRTGWRYAWSSDSQLVAYANELDGVRLFDAATGKLVRRMAAHESTIKSLFFSPDGKRLAGGDSDGSIVFWGTDSGEKEMALRIWDYEAIPYPFTTLPPYGYPVFSPDGTHIWSREPVSTQYILWDLKSQRAVLKGRAHMIFSNDGNSIATLLPSKGGAVIYDTRTLEKRLDLASNDGGPIFVVAFSPDGDRIATGGHRQIQLWDSQTGRELLTLTDFDMDVQSVAFSFAGSILATGEGDGSVKLFELPDEKKVEQWLKEDL